MGTGLGPSPNRQNLWKTDPSPTVSVGNLAMGGRGKTPVVGYLARMLLAAGERPAILSRGYGRRVVEDGVVIVSDGVHVLADVDRAGDEPLMLARTLPGAAVLVCEQRAIAGALATRVLGASVLILDDGFQHRAMRRDIDVVVIAPSDLHGRPVPLGRLRESPSALQRADAIIIDGDLAEGERARLPRPSFRLRRSLGVPVSLEAARPAPVAGARIVALAAIAQPERFAEALESGGWEVARVLAFRDHHRFSARDIGSLARAVRESRADAVLTTEKDAMRLMACRPLPVPVAAVPLIVALDPPGAFDAWFASRLGALRS